MSNKAERMLVAEQLDALVAELRTHTQMIAARFTSQILNDVLETALLTFDATGVIALEYTTSIGAVSVANHSANPVTVQAAGPVGDAAPAGGRGMALIPTKTAAVVNLTGTVLTLYGTAGGKVSLQVFTRSQPPSWGPA